MRKFLFTILFCLSSSLAATPATYLFTINTEQAAGYAEWLRGSAKTIATATGATQAGLCLPRAGGVTAEDVYVYLNYSSMSAAMAADFTQAKVVNEIQKNSARRTVVAQDLWAIIKPFATSGSTGQKSVVSGFFAKANDVGRYVTIVKKVEAAYKKNGFGDIGIQVSMPSTGDYSGLVWVMLAAGNGSRLGEAWDAQSSRWASPIIKRAQRLREIDRGFLLDCEVIFAAE
ncbi:MAG TPA: hypothetical protein DGR97_05185 [Gammaproteobacteria bacterium]|nr:hypothetical protein [Gammaproteobacteria bacterium]